MKHFGIIQWVDFARGLTSDEDVPAMRDHLAEGCDECTDLVEFCQSLTGVAKRMASGAVPEWVARRGKAVFPVQAPPRAKRSLQIPVELIYDSFLVPAPAGLRATWQVGWQALFRAGNCSLDLRVEPGSGTQQRERGQVDTLDP